MAHFDPEIQSELNRQRMIEEIKSIHLENKALRGKNALSRALTLFGEWMVARGEKLRQKNSTPQTSYSELNKRIAHR